jgi:hypothetical protein
MLDKIYLFLQNNKMNLNPHKSKIISNQDTKNHNFKINDQTIEIIPKDQLVRILGVYWTMDGQYSKTIKHAEENL